MVGCCHGRPFHWGVCYQKEHADAGFAPYLVGIRLFPLQAVESFWVLGVVIVGTILILNGHPPGAALAWYVVSYGFGRFCFEFLRGDPERPYYWGFSQPQWISLILMLFAISAELGGMLPYYSWHVITTVLMVLATITISLKRRFQKTPKFQLRHPRHVKEVAQALEMTSKSAAETPVASNGKFVPAAIPISCTSQGIRISAGKINNKVGCIHHYTFSHKNKTMTDEMAKILAKLILQLKHLSCSYEMGSRNQGIYHLLIHPSSQTDEFKLETNKNGKHATSTLAANNDVTDGLWRYQPASRKPAGYFGEAVG